LLLLVAKCAFSDCWFDEYLQKNLTVSEIASCHSVPIESKKDLHHDGGRKNSLALANNSEIPTARKW
jgi:hypothetical protein